MSKLVYDQQNLVCLFHLVSMQGDIHFDRQNKGNVYLTFVRTTFNRFDKKIVSIKVHRKRE